MPQLHDLIDKPQSEDKVLVSSFIPQLNLLVKHINLMIIDKDVLKATSKSNKTIWYSLTSFIQTVS